MKESSCFISVFLSRELLVQSSSCSDGWRSRLGVLLPIAAAVCYQDSHFLSWSVLGQGIRMLQSAFSCGGLGTLAVIWLQPLFQERFFQASPVQWSVVGVFLLLFLSSKRSNLIYLYV